MNTKNCLLDRIFVVTFLVIVLYAWCIADQAMAQAFASVEDEFINDEFGEFDEFDEFDEFNEFDEFDEFDRHDGEVFDPLSGYNRAMTTFNDRFYFVVLEPTTAAYARVTPLRVRVSVNNFFRNLGYPVRFANNVFQLKGEAALRETTRFMVNSTVGIVGFFDPAKTWLGIDAHPEDFGQTLGWYGVGSGFHIVWPLLGPSNLRDSTGMWVDFLFDPVFYLEGWYIGSISMAVDEFNYTSLHPGEYERLRREAIDLYTFLRNAYEQNREKKIRE
jgi:phospholipid-binding lipoprotein MlaA